MTQSDKEKMNPSLHAAVGTPDPSRQKRKTVWPLNLFAVLLLPLFLLSSPDALSQAISGLAVTLVLGCAYLSLRIRFNFVALSLFSVAAYFQFIFLLFLFKKI